MFSIQVVLESDRINLRDYRLNTLAVTFDRHTFAAARVFSVTNRHENNLCFGTAAARNSERCFEWPDFFPSFDGKRTCHHRRQRIEIRLLTEGNEVNEAFA